MERQKGLERSTLSLKPADLSEWMLASPRYGPEHLAHEAIANAEVVRRMYDAFLAKDEAGLRRILHPEVEWIQCARFPGGEHRHGVDEVLEKVFAGLHSEWDDFRA